MSELNLILHRFKQFFITENNKPTKKGIAVVIAALLYIAVLGSNKEEVKPVEGNINTGVQGNAVVPPVKEPTELSKHNTYSSELIRYSYGHQAKGNVDITTTDTGLSIKAEDLLDSGGVPLDIQIIVDKDTNTAKDTITWTIPINKEVATHTENYIYKLEGTTLEIYSEWGTQYDGDPKWDSNVFNIEGQLRWKKYEIELLDKALIDALTTKPLNKVVIPEPKVVIAALPPNAITGVTVDIKDNSTCLNIRKSPNGEIVDCLEQGTVLKPIIKEQDGWLQLSSGNWAWKESTSLVSNLPSTNNVPPEVDISSIETFISGSCRELKERGLGPFYEGDINYTSNRDRDEDGIACE